MPEETTGACVVMRLNIHDNENVVITRGDVYQIEEFLLQFESMEELRAYIHIAYRDAFTRIKSRPYDIERVKTTIRFAPIHVLRQIIKKDETSSESSDSELETLLDSSHRELIVEEIIKFFNLCEISDEEFYPHSRHVDEIQREFNEYFIWTYDELERYGVIDMIEEQMHKYNAPREIAVDLACYDVESRIHEIDFDDEFISFFNYTLSLGYLRTFEEQYYWIGEDNAYDLLLRPVIMRLIRNEKSRIRKELII